MIPSSSPPPAGLWAITSFYNPLRYRSRLPNYRVFRRHLGVPLLTVELAYEHDFDLREGDAEILIQRRGGDILWQKERLLNVALEHLPDSCKSVVWIDADLVYTRRDWPREVARLLETYPVIQAYRRAIYLAREATPACPTPASDRPEVFSLVWALTTGMASPEDLRRVVARSRENAISGFAWAARRDVLERVGFYDACIVGGGDRAFLCAAYGYFGAEIISHHMAPRRAQHYLSWARPAFDAIGGRVGFLDAELLHLWHGDLAARRTSERHGRLASFDFDPGVDLAIAEGGCWRWSSDKPGLHQFLRDYFAARKDDG